jgi:hypothetical protein
LGRPKAAAIVAHAPLLLSPKPPPDVTLPAVCHSPGPPPSLLEPHIALAGRTPLPSPSRVQALPFSLGQAMHMAFLPFTITATSSSTVTALYAASPLRPSAKIGARCRPDAHQPHLTLGDLLSSANSKFSPTLVNSATAILPVKFVTTGERIVHRPLRRGAPSGG